jgi:c-di-GMP-binding flagellar brake protein YcgR
MFALLKKQTEDVRTAGSVEHNPSESFFDSVDDKRKFFRIDTSIGLRYWPLPAGGQTGTADPRQVNLSGGGIRFALADPLPVGELVWLEMILSDAQSSIISCFGRVVRRSRGETKGGEAAFEFTNLAPRDQDRLIAFCLAEQRKLLRQKVLVAC